MSVMSAGNVRLLRRVTNLGSILNAHPYVWEEDALNPKIKNTKSKHLWHLNCALLFIYILYLAAEVWDFHGRPEYSHNLLDFTSIVFVLLFHVFGATLELTVAMNEADLAGFIRKLRIYADTAQLNKTRALSRYEKICKKIMEFIFYGAVMDSVIIVITAVYQLDSSPLIMKINPGDRMQYLVRLAFVVLHIHIGYIFCSLTSLFAPLFFAVAFTVIDGLSANLM